jgi:hypothetical protein
MYTYLSNWCVLLDYVQVGFDLAFLQNAAGVATRLEGRFNAVLKIDIFETPAVTVACVVGVALAIH